MRFTSDLNRGYQWLLPSSPPLPSAAVATSREGSQSSRSVTFLDRGLLYWNCLIVVHHMGAASNGGRFRIEADAQPSSIHTNTAPSRDRPAPGSVTLPRGLFGNSALKNPTAPHTLPDVSICLALLCAEIAA